MLNVVALMGRLVADPELRHTPNGVATCTFRIAVDRSFVRAGEERKADFIDIVVWRQTAEFVCKYFHKGNLIAVDGSIRLGGVKLETQHILYDETLDFAAAAERAAAERHERHQDEPKAHAHNAAELRAALDFIDEVGGEKRDQHFNRDLADHAQERQDRGLFILL